jgi:hypothetical protein
LQEIHRKIIDNYQVIPEFDFTSELGKISVAKEMKKVSGKQEDQMYCLKTLGFGPNAINGSKINYEIAVMRRLIHPNIASLHEVICTHI